MVGAVARVMQPGCKLDCLPCLISPQGFNKSKGLQALVPDPRWFSDDLSTNVTDRDAKESLGGKWIIELSEFPHIRRDVDPVKAFFSRQVDRFRHPYGRATADHPRQTVFCATANMLEFIDVTGNRRVWPVSLAKEVDVEAILRDRDQLWAEAVHLYDQGYKWWLPPGVEAIAAVVQDAYLEDDGFDEMIVDWLDAKAPRDKNGNVLPFPLRPLAEGLGFSYTPGERNSITRSEEMRLARRLRRLGFRPVPRRPRQNGHRVRVWVPVQQSTH
jgi:putative DNA primase/helicase